MAEYFMAVFLFNIKCTSGLYLFNQVLYKGPDPSRLTPESDFGCEFAGMTSIGRCTYLLYSDAIVGICTSPSC
jgi:hypothetical protein